MSQPEEPPKQPPFGAEDASPNPIDTPRAGRLALRGSAVRGGGYALSVLLSLIAAPLLIRHLGVDGYGRYATVVSLVTLVGSVVDAGLNGIAIREWSTSSGAERTVMMRDLLGIRVAFTSTGILVGAVFAIVVGYDRTLVLGVLLVGAGFVLQTVANLLTVPLQGDLRFGWVSIIDLVRQGIAVPLIVALVIAGSGLLPFFAVPVPASLVALAGTALLVRGRMPLMPSFHLRSWWPQLRSTVAYAAAIALSAVYLRITIVIMSLVSTAAQTGYFATSFRVIEVLVSVPMLAIGAAFPILARSVRDDRARFRRAAERIYDISLISGTLIALALALGASFVIEVIGGAAAAPATDVLQIQGLTLVATFVATAGNYVLLSLHRHRALLIANGSALLASIALSFALVPIDGARGGAIATVGGETVLAVAISVLVMRSGAGIRLPLRTIPVVAVAAAAGGAVGLIPHLHPLLAALAGSVVFLVVLWLGRRFPPEVLELLHARRVRAS